MREKQNENLSGRWNDKELILRECGRYRALLLQIADRLLLLGQLADLGTAARSFNVPLRLYRGTHSNDWLSQWRKPG